MSTAGILLTSVIVVVVVGAAGSLFAWWKSKQIKEEIKNGTYVTKELKQKLKKEGISVKQYKQDLKNNKDAKAGEDVVSHEDYINELRRMG